MSDLTAVPGRLFILGDRLTVQVIDCTVTLWRRAPGRPRSSTCLLSHGAGTRSRRLRRRLVAARAARSGTADGSVRVWPCREDEVLCIGLRGRRASVLELPYEPVAALLAGAGPHGAVRG